MLEKKMGQAQQPEELVLEAAIAKIDIWQGKTVTYERILGGITNINWKIHVAEDDSFYFLKVPGENTELFINRQAAFDAGLKAAASGCAPKLVYYIEDDEIEVHEFLDTYRSCSVADMLGQNVRKNVVQAYRSIHGGELFKYTKTGFEQISEHLAHAKEVGARLPPDLDFLLWQSNRAEQALNASGIELAPCYNDAYVTNYMVAENNSIRIIDWEYAANNDPMWDLSLYCLECFFDTTTRKEIVEEYFGTYRVDMMARIDVYGPLVAIKWGLWAALQGSVSEIPFDFCKYSDLLFLRSRYALRGPRFEEALLQV